MSHQSLRERLKDINIEPNTREGMPWVKAALRLGAAARTLRAEFLSKFGDVDPTNPDMVYFANPNDLIIGQLIKIPRPENQPGSLYGSKIIIDQYVGTTGRLVNIEILGDGTLTAKTPDLIRLNISAIKEICGTLTESLPISYEAYRRHLELIKPPN